MPIKHSLPFLILPLYALAGNVMAESFDGSKPLLCATVETIECGPHAECQYGTADSLGFPQFLHIDADKKTISADKPDGSRLNATIASVSKLGDRLVLQGVENNLGWSVSISRVTGRMAVAIAGDQIVFSVFGACTVD